MKFRRIAICCFVFTVIALGVYVFIPIQHQNADDVPSVYAPVHDSDNYYAVATPEQNRDVLVLTHAIPVFDCDCVIPIPEESPNPEPRHYIHTEVVPPMFDSVRGFRNGFAVVGMGGIWNDEEWRWERGLYGLIDREGNLVLPIIYDSIGTAIVVDNCIFVTATYDGKQGILTVHGDEILPLIYSRVSVRNNFAVATYGTGDNRTTGLFNLSTREFVIPKGIYMAISDFISEDRTWVTLGVANGWRWGAVDMNSGELLTPMVYTGHATTGAPGWFSNGVISANIDVDGGREAVFLDIDGNQITQFAFDAAHGRNFSHVQRNNRWGIADTEGNYIVEPMFDTSMGRQVRGEDFWYATVRLEGFAGIWDILEGRLVVPNIYSAIDGIYANSAIVRYGDWWTAGVLNIETGEYIIPLGYMNFGNDDLRNGLIPASKGTAGNDLRVGLVDIQTGEVMADFIYDDLRWVGSIARDHIIFRTGAEWVRRSWDGEEFYALEGGFFGVMDAYGNIIIPAIYSDIRYMHDSSGLFAVSNGTNWGIINSNGEVVLPIEYTHIGQFWHPPGFGADLAPVNIGAQLVWDNSADSYEGFGDYVLRGGKWGFIDTSGNLVIPAELEYDLVYAVTNGMAAVMRDGKWGFVAVTPVHILY